MARTELVITEKDKVNLEKGEFDNNLSFSQLDENTKVFSISTDRAIFEKPLDIIMKVLKASGFVVNLENILSCIDDMVMGIGVRLTSSDLAKEQPQVKQYIPTITFGLPKKNRFGYLLKKFYNEIEEYEAQIESLRSDSKNKEKTKTLNQVQEELKNLTKENESLKEKIEYLSDLVAKFKKSNLDASKALASQNLLPPTIRIATVKAIDLDERNISLSIGRKRLAVPLALLNCLPVLGEQCLVTMEDGVVRGVFFYENKGNPLKIHLARILYVKGKDLKVRDVNRGTFRISAANEKELDIVKNFQRGQSILIYFANNKIVRFSQFCMPDINLFSQKVQEAIVIQQLGDAYFDTISDQVNSYCKESS